MEKRFDRTELIIGKTALNTLEKSKIIIFGVGGVGSYVAEALGRAGIGHIALCDKDSVSITNINRQIPALTGTIGRSKVNVMAERLKDINPEVYIEEFELFYNEDTEYKIDLKSYDYVVDAIDSMKSKLYLVKKAKELDVPVISSMGAGNKINPAMFEVADIYKTEVDPIAKIMRKKLRSMEIKSLKVVYSKEEPVKLNQEGIIGSLPFVPGACGLIIAGEVFKDILGIDKHYLKNERDML